MSNNIITKTDKNIQEEHIKDIKISNLLAYPLNPIYDFSIRKKLEILLKNSHRKKDKNQYYNRFYFKK